MQYEILFYEDAERYPFWFEHHTNVECVSHVHHTIEIVIVTEGEVCMQVDGERYRIGKNEAILVLPFEPHSFSSERDNQCTVLVFPHETAPSFFAFLQQNQPKKRQCRLSDAMNAMIAALPEGEGKIEDLIDAQGILMPLCRELYHGCAFVGGKKQYDTLFLSALNLIHTKFYEEQLSVEMTAKQLGIHPVTLSRLFLQNAGIRFHSYVNAVRLFYAGRMLRERSMTVTEVAYAAGFGSVRSFNRLFLERYGEPPSQYQKNRTEKRIDHVEDINRN